MTRFFIILPLLPSFLYLSCLKQIDDGSGAAIANPPPAARAFNWSRLADSADNSLEQFYNASGQYYETSTTNPGWTNYWPTAHTLDVLTDAWLRDSSATVKIQMDDLLTGMRRQNGNTWLGYYYDDMEWMALASLRAYQATGDVKYAKITDTLWTDIKNGWSTDLGGGIWWRKDDPSKNTPSNMPAAILAARLYELFRRPDDLQWAKKIYAWQKATLYDPGSGWVYDNIDKAGKKNTRWKFTYNQGTFLGAALELFKLTSDAQYLTDATMAADFAINSGQLTSAGLLKDEGGGDGGLFKGIFVRYLTRLILDGPLPAAKRSSYVNFLTTNAKTLWTTGTQKPQLLFGTAWNSPPATGTALTTQLSGIMLFEAMAQLAKANLVTD